jgi:hypothetical protein
MMLDIEFTSLRLQELFKLLMKLLKLLSTLWLQEVVDPAGVVVAQVDLERELHSRLQ